MSSGGPGLCFNMGQNFKWALGLRKKGKNMVSSSIEAWFRGVR